MVYLDYDKQAEPSRHLCNVNQPTVGVEQQLQIRIWLDPGMDPNGKCYPVRACA